MPSQPFALTGTCSDRTAPDLRRRATSRLIRSGTDGPEDFDCSSFGRTNALTKADLEARRWDHASLKLALQDASGGSNGTVCMGELGQVAVRGQTFESSVSIAPRKLASSPCVLTAPECRALLGDKRCGVDLRTRRMRVAVAHQDGVRLTLDRTIEAQYRFGRVRWLSGANTGIDQDIVDIIDGNILLREQPPLECIPGDRLEITQGCDGQPATCGDTFSNIANFRGEPNLPHTDALMRYPGA
jgi:uncharacterized phage protein (TIGR02218 family)